MRALALVPLIACTAQPVGPIDLRGHEVDLLVDDTSLAVSGCLTAFIGGCTQPRSGDAMAITVDGQTFGIPFNPVPPDPNVVLDTGSPAFRATLSTPSDLHVEVALAGDTDGIDLPDTFSIASPPAQVSRSAAAELTITHDVLPGAGVSATETVTCGNDSFGPAEIAEKVPGVLHVFIAVPESGGTCEHVVQISESVALSASSIFFGSVGRRERVVFTSVP